MLSYNIEKKRDEGWEGRDITKVTDTIVEANPDVVGLQEDTSGWNTQLGALTSAGYTRLHGSGNGDEYLDIFYKASKFNVIASGEGFYKKLAVSLSVTNIDNVDMDLDDQGSKEYSSSTEKLLGINGVHKGRFFHYAVLKDKDTGIEVLVVNTHFHYGSTAYDTESLPHHQMRDYEARILLAWLATMNYENVVIMGDLNADGTSTGTGRGSQTLQILSNGGLDFSKEIAINKGDVGGTLASTSTYDRRDPYVFDHIFVGNVDVLYYTVLNNMNDSNNTRYPSDHLPIVSTIRCYNGYEE